MRWKFIFGPKNPVHWSLNKAAFFDNIGTILTYAIFGTLFNAMAIGFSVYGVSKAGLIPGFEEDLELIHCLLFGSIISAVDPVAVIAVFDEIQVLLLAPRDYPWILMIWFSSHWVVIKTDSVYLGLSQDSSLRKSNCGNRTPSLYF